MDAVAVHDGPAATVTSWHEATGARFGVIAMPSGPVNPGMIATMVLVAVSIAETVLLLKLTVYAKAPSGVMATPAGVRACASLMEATTVVVAVSMTETELPTKLATYAKAPLGVKAMPKGWFAVATVAVTVFVAVSITEMPPTACAMLFPT